jgi:multiple sugar transport system ATP-binding protein
MGRAIVRDPKVFLFDEPLSNLDAKLRVAMRAEIKSLHQRLKTTTVYVTHDQVEAMTMADRIVVMHDGRIEQIGAPLDVYDHPRTLYVARFIGAPSINVIAADVSESATGRVVRTRDGKTLGPAPAHVATGPVSAAMRPEHLQPGVGGPLAGTISVVENLGHQTYAFVETVDGRLCVLLDRSLQPRLGDAIELDVRPGHVHLFDAASGASLAQQA